MASIDPSLMEAAGFVGAAAQQAVGSAQSKAAIQTNQLQQQGTQARQNIYDKAESRGMLRSSFTAQDIANQTAEQANQQQLTDLGVSDTLARANMDVMQELAQQQLQQQQDAQQRQFFDAQMALKWQELQMNHPEQPIDWEQVSKTTGGTVTGPTSTGRGW